MLSENRLLTLLVGVSSEMISEMIVVKHLAFARDEIIFYFLSYARDANGNGVSTIKDRFNGLTNSNFIFGYSTFA